MTEQPPSTPESTPPSAPESATPTETLPAVESEAKSRNTKRLAIVGISAVVVLALAGGAFAVIKKLDGGGPQPSEVLPASALAYARVDLDPSASQKIALFKLIRKFPEAAKSIGIKSPDQDVRKLLLKDAISGCGLTYDKDIKPWIGNRVGVALLKDAKSPIIAVQVSNEAQARKGINTLFTKCADSPKPGIAFLNGYALVTEKPGVAAAARDAAQKAPLSENKAFIADNKALDGEGFASAWLTTKAFSAFASESGLSAGLDSKVLGNTSVAMSLRASGDSLELQSVGKAAKGAKARSAGIAELPANTALALAFSGGFGGDDPTFTKDFQKDFEQGFAEGFAGVMGLGDPSADPDAVMKSFEADTGLKLPEDLETLLGGRLAFAVGSRNLKTLPTLSGPDDVSALDIGLAMHSDPDKAADLASRLSDLAAGAGIQLSVEKLSDGAVLATNPDAAKMFGGKGKLGTRDSFKRVIPSGAKASSAFYLDVAAVLKAIKASNPPEYVASVVDQLKPISAVGFSTTTEDGYARASGRLTFAK